MSANERLWLNGFATASQVLSQDRLALEEVQQELEDRAAADQRWLAPWKAGFNAGIRACFGS
jgi:hypothetical protein